MTLPQTSLRMTEEEYLRMERAAQFKSEFFEGEMFAMAGGTARHSLTAANLGHESGNRLKGQPCVAYNSDLRIKIEATGLFTYPDLSVICGTLEFANSSDDTVTNPTLLAEVLSDSTEAYDRGRKFEQYRQIPALREYLLASQREPRLELYTRQPGGQWLLSEAAGLEATLEIPSLRVTISLGEVFAQVEFVPVPIRTTTPRQPV